MRKLAWTLALCAATALSVPAAAQQAAPAVQVRPAEAAVTAAAEKFVADGQLDGIVVAIGHPGAEPTFVSRGRIAFEPGAATATPDSLWRIYSMTKPITGIAAMILVEEGKLRLDQPISDFFPAFKQMKVLINPDTSLDSRPAKTEITVRHLLTHTAGLGYTIITKGPLLEEYNRLGINPAAVNAAFEAQMRPVRPASLQAFAERLATLPLAYEPGTKWSYSIGLDLLGAVIEKASGMSFDAFLKARLFDPLKMQSTFFTVPAGDAGRLATNYYYMGDNRVPLDPGAGSLWLSPPSFPYGGAGLVSSARDYERFLRMLANGGTLDGVRVLKPETAKLAMSDLLPPGVDRSALGATSGSAGKLGFGAGGSVYLDDVAGGPAKGTYGWGGAAGTIAFVDPAHRVVGVVMVNYMPSEKWPVRAAMTKAIYGDATP